MQSDMHYGASHYIFKRAEMLRENMTPAETIMWNFLKANALQLKFRRQHPIATFIADFYCHSLKLVIEIDGTVHNNQENYDIRRDAFLTNLGLFIYRISYYRVLHDLNNVMTELENFIVENYG